MIDKKSYLVRRTDQPDLPVRWLPESHVHASDSCARWGTSWVPVEILRTRPALARKVINQRIEHVKRVFAWAVSEELVPVTAHQALQRVRGLRAGHPGTREMPKVRAVAINHIEATLPFLLPQVAAMVNLQMLTGARSTEVCLMRGRNIHDRDQPVWKYVIDPSEVAREEDPESRIANLHKTAHHEDANGQPEVKILPLGPRAQEVLKLWLRENPDEFLFQPREARASQYAERRQRRKTPLFPSHILHQEGKKKMLPKRAPRDHYDRHSYDHAIARAAKKAGVPHWHPHQLKHTCASLVRNSSGLEASKCYMGHRKISTTELYAEASWEKVAQIALAQG